MQRPGLHAEGSGDGDPRSTNLTALAVAEPICRTAYWNPAARLPGSRCHLRCTPSVAGSGRVFRLLQQDTYTPVVRKRHAARSSDPATWSHRHCADSVRPASLLRADMIFGRHRTHASQYRSDSRTHARPLHRPSDLEELFRKNSRASLMTRRRSSSDCQRRRRNCKKGRSIGIDVVDDSEFSKVDFFSYAKYHLQGIESRPSNRDRANRRLGRGLEKLS